MSRNDLIQLEGVVVGVLGGGTMDIECQDNVIIRGILYGRMKKTRLR